jgi:5-amino-6-(5-phosphoribosylamino)uracil reductase
MADRPYTVLSCGVSLDGYLDSATTRRLALSNAADFDRVDGVRAGCDAIMVGAATVRNDDPRLLVRSCDRQRDRVARGLPPSPVKVTVTATGNLDPASRFFTVGDSAKIVYATADVAGAVHARLAAVADVVALGAGAGMRDIAEDLCARGVNRLMVEGGATLHTQFLTADLADELQLVIAPIFVGDSRARRFVLDGCYPWTEQRRADLADVRRIDDVVLLRYALSPRFEPGPGAP